LIERWAPLRPVEREFFAQWFEYLADLAERVAVPSADREQWRRLAGGDLLDDPELYVSEGQVVAVGRVPEPTSAGARRPVSAMQDRNAAMTAG
jgi:hypothetical protein